MWLAIGSEIPGLNPGNSGNHFFFFFQFYFWKVPKTIMVSIQSPKISKATKRQKKKLLQWWFESNTYVLTYCINFSYTFSDFCNNTSRLFVKLKKMCAIIANMTARQNVQEMKWKKNTKIQWWTWWVSNPRSNDYKVIVLTITPPGITLSVYDKTIIHLIYTRADSALGW